MGPVDADIGPQAIQQFMRDDFELVVAEHVDGTLVVGKCIVEGDLFGCEAGFFASLTGFPDFLRQRDQFLQHFDGADRIGVVSRNGLI